MRNIYLMYVIVFLQGFVFYGPVATLFRQARGLSMSEIFFIESISWVLMIILEVPWGWFSDRFGYKKTLVLANILFFVSKIVFYMSHSFGMFLFERVLLSVVMSGLSGCDIALIYSSIKENEVQNVFGRYSAFGTLGFFMACISSSFIIPISLEFTALFTIFPYALAAILSLFLEEVKDFKKESPKFRESFTQAFKDTSIIIFIISIGLVMEVFQAVTVFLNQSQYLKSGIDPRYFGAILASVQMIRLFSAKSDNMSKKFGNTGAIIILNATMVISCVILIFTSNAILSIISVTFISLCAALIGPIETDIKNKHIRVSSRATILSIYSMSSGMISSLGNVIIGKAADYSIEMGFATCCAMSILGLALMLIYHRNTSQNSVEILMELKNNKSV
ncbi:MFS transporter [Peptoclostridium litorale]|nr:MFS transporter [Peptoclostridium litorale]